MSWSSLCGLQQSKDTEWLHILNFSSKAIKASQDVNEPSDHDDGIKRALLNSRSIVSKLPDIEQDTNFTSANVACFTETWLKPNQNSPHS